MFQTLVDFDDDVDLPFKDEDTFSATDLRSPSVSYKLDSPLHVKRLGLVFHTLILISVFFAVITSHAFLLKLLNSFGKLP